MFLMRTDQTHVFDATGRLMLDRVSRYVAEPLARRSLTGLAPNDVFAAVEEVNKLARVHSEEVVRQEVSELEKALLPSHALVNSRVATNRQGEHGREYTYFAGRSGVFPSSYTHIRLLHSLAASKVADTLFELIRPLAAEAHLIMRYKLPGSIKRKMRSKGLALWQIGDILGFLICPPTLVGVASVGRVIEDTFAADILYKQNGFADSIIDNQLLDRAVARRVFHIVRHDAVVCFELQVMTFRQLVYVHFSHPDYVGTPYGAAARKALYNFGDLAYLLDLKDLMYGRSR